MTPELRVPKRLSARFFFDPPTALSAADLAPVFHSWISQQAVEEMLIDVVDYGHVGEGPLLMLVCLEADYVLDTADGRPGIRYIRKRSVPHTLTGALALTLAGAARACRLLAASPLQLAFNLAEVEIEILDKLNYPAGAAQVADLEKALLAVGKKAFAQENVRVEKVKGDAKRPLKMVLKGGGSSLEDIENRIKAGHFLQPLYAAAAG